MIVSSSGRSLPTEGTAPVFRQPRGATRDGGVIDTLCVVRPVLNAGQIIEASRRAGLASTLGPTDLHVTLVVSRAAMAWNVIAESDVYDVQQEILIRNNQLVSLAQIGTEGAFALLFECDILKRRFQEIRSRGVSADWDTFIPHVTLTWRPVGGHINGNFDCWPDIILGGEACTTLDPEWHLTRIEI